jgi:hypothetical protein
MKSTASTGARQQQTTKDKEHSVNQLADQALKNYEQVLHTGLRMQEEAVRCWTSMFNTASSGDEWHKPFNNLTSATNDMLPLTHQRMAEMLGLMEKNSRTGADLMKKAVDAAQTSVPAESQAKWIDFWSSSMGAARSNAEALTQIGARAMDSWIDFVRQNSEVTEIRVPKAA